MAETNRPPVGFHQMTMNGELCGIAVGPRGFSSPFKTKRKGYAIVDRMVKMNHLTAIQGQNICEQIEASGLKPPVPNNFHSCADKECWIPLEHGHFTIDDQDYTAWCSTSGAMAELKDLRTSPAISAEDAIRIEGEILATGLPPSSDVDIFNLAYRDFIRRQMQQTVVVEQEGGHPTKEDGGPIRHMAKGGNC